MAMKSTFNLSFTDNFLQHCQDFFVPMYKRVSEGFWNNSVYGNVKRPYYTVNFDVGVAEYYVPTVLNGEGFIQYHRIVILVLPELEKETYEDEILRLIKPINKPLGYIDSDTIFIVAPKGTKRHRLRVFKEKFKAMLKIKRVAGCFCIPIINASPEIAFKKVLAHLVNFWTKRVTAFLEKLKLQPWQYNYKLRNILITSISVIENYNSQIIHCLRSMTAHLSYFEDCLKGVLREIGKLNVLSRVIGLLKPLDLGTRMEICVRLKEVLTVEGG